MDVPGTVAATLTAGDLMSRDVMTVRADMPLRDAAARLAERGVRGAPVVDAAGRCIGVLSVSDCARWAARAAQEQVPLPRTCSYQSTCREPGGHETTLCNLPDGACPLQKARQFENGTTALECLEPNSAPTDWQMVELEELPGDAVRDLMTTTVLTVEPTAPVPELARALLEHAVHRLFVVDENRRPVGVVTVDDLLQVLAHPELFPGGVPE